MSKQAQHSAHRINGTFLAPLFSPKGMIEGALLDVDGNTVQLTIEKEQPELSRLLQGLTKSQKLVVEAMDAPPSPKGDSRHVVRTLDRVLTIDDVDVDVAGASPIPKSFHGKIARVHYARHGEANGVVLDSGDFIHLKPHGFVGARLSIGDEVEAVGPAARLATGTGFVVEAEKVNGVAVAPKAKKKPGH
jgi:hypothetical protein